MNKFHTEFRGPNTSFQVARSMALGVAMDHQMRDPTIMSWHRQGDPDTSPAFDGGAPDAWWEKYGTGNGGRMQVDVGDEYGFILMDARGFETVGITPLRNLSDSHGNDYLCLTPLIGKSATRPSMSACTLLDGWAADQN
jgi:hypothetical protein